MTGGRHPNCVARPESPAGGDEAQDPDRLSVSGRRSSTRVAFDSVILGACLHPKAAYPQPVDRVPERLRHFVETLEAARATIILPAPALSELLVLAAGDTAAYVAPVDPQRPLFADTGDGSS